MLEHTFLKKLPTAPLSGIWLIFYTSSPLRNLLWKECGFYYSLTWWNVLWKCTLQGLWSCIFFWVDTTFLTMCLTTLLSCSRVIGIFQCWQSSTSGWSPAISFFWHTARLHQRLVTAHGETQGDKKSNDGQRKPNLVRACGTQISNSLVCQRLNSFLPWYKTHWGKQIFCLQKALQSEECYWNKGHRACYGCRKNTC